jgi:alkanesulfonate monooxygenase SsuD/methylene tetrahydromethanopterin reductase-like flavin-dependent oxidoreductase (luciferase family)
MQATQVTSLSFGTTYAPGQRYHSPTLAQAGATFAEIFPGRLWIALGRGKALNEGIMGDP